MRVRGQVRDSPSLLVFCLTKGGADDLGIDVETSSKPRLTATAAREIVAWFDGDDSIPEHVRAYLKPLRDFLAANPDPQAFSRSQLTSFLRAMGITASSEKLRSGRPLDDVPKAASSQQLTAGQRRIAKLERARRLGEWHRELQDKHARQAEKLEAKIATQPPDEPSIDGESKSTFEQPAVPSLDEIELTDEQKAQGAADTEALVANLQLGDGPDPRMAPANETLMPSGTVLHEEQQISIPAILPEHLCEAEIKQVLHDKRVRYDFSMVVTRIELDVEKKVVVAPSGERRVVAPSTHEFGPRRFTVTWSWLATLAVMVGQYAIPMNRLGTMLTSAGKRFTASRLSRHLHYVAWRFVPIYKLLFRQLANSGILSGDDTPCRVVEVRTYLKRRKSETSSDSKGDGEKRKPPWYKFRNPAASRKSVEECEQKKRDRQRRRESGDRNAKPTVAETPSLGTVIGCLLQFEWPRKDGSADKIGLNTSVVSGRTTPDDPRSLVVFYRSHLGGFGNLLTSLLRLRDKKLRDLTVQSDLSTSNLVSDSSLLEWFTVNLVGCMSHARRVFKVHKKDDPLRCSHMLHLFTGIAMHEQLLDEFGRNEQNVKAVRNEQSRSIWNDIKNLAAKMANKWSAATKLGQACRYIIRNFSKLTAYLDNHLLEATNNLRERMLRTEKLIEKSSLFRRSLEGRFVLDIIRTITQTAVAAAVPVREYIEFVLRADPNEVSRSPELFTPFAYRERLDNMSQQKQTSAAETTGEAAE